MSTHALARFFSPDPRHDGVRPVQLWGLRLFYLLMVPPPSVARRDHRTPVARNNGPAPREGPRRRRG